jgi:large subunit ribosomal protein L32
MAVPKQKHTRSRRNKRRMHLFLKEPVLAVCQKCGKPVFPHTVCRFCGYYKGREVVNVFEKLEKKERKLREKEIKAKEEAEKKEVKKEGGLSWEELSKK